MMLSLGLSDPMGSRPSELAGLGIQELISFLRWSVKSMTLDVLSSRTILRVLTIRVALETNSLAELTHTVRFVMAWEVASLAAT
jgi:hypothetical protein